MKYRFEITDLETRPNKTSSISPSVTQVKLQSRESSEAWTSVPT